MSLQSEGRLLVKEEEMSPLRRACASSSHLHAGQGEHDRSRASSGDTERGPGGRVGTCLFLQSELPAGEDCRHSSRSFSMDGGRHRGVESPRGGVSPKFSEEDSLADDWRRRGAREPRTGNAALPTSRPQQPRHTDRTFYPSPSLPQQEVAGYCSDSDPPEMYGTSTTQCSLAIGGPSHAAHDLPPRKTAGNQFSATLVAERQSSSIEKSSALNISGNAVLLDGEGGVDVDLDMGDFDELVDPAVTMVDDNAQIASTSPLGGRSALESSSVVGVHSSCDFLRRGCEREEAAVPAATPDTKVSTGAREATSCYAAPGMEEEEEKHLESLLQLMEEE